ncbi:GNAT family N-acetyltransferase [Alicyclobacillus sp. SO9]|uniref:GNAT family N-acetyltransferase n=1 Tax=Alicyclobacillus sp. SO9 TaxID=2665646 RepID=UPI0018E76556|nr:GNAT family protein [Alicyclobacillus sp. SO9]QQE78579.1 GNAT family N-acetyltransferase [Alicyclobacillus sp. SO9]
MKLVGDKIYLRFLEVHDAAAKLALNVRNRSFFEPFVTTRDDSYYTLETQLQSIKVAVDSKEKDQGYFWGVFLRESDDLIGFVSLTEVVRGPLQSGWLGYSLDSAQNGRGYTTEAVRLVVSYAFNTLQLHRIEAGVMPHNLGSIRVLEKAGFKREGLSKKNVLINGKWEDHLHFAVINPED